MAIFNISDSSINEFLSEGDECTSLNEHGGAHRRIINNLKKEKDDLDNKYRKINNAAISDKRKRELESNLDKRYRDINDKTKHFIDDTADSIDKNAELVNKHNEKGKKGNLRYKGELFIPEIKEHIRSLAAEKKPKNPEMHRIINQRSKLKEAAEYILSVLDEMDYIEESEKKWSFK